jgi:hypothetical protein
LDEVSAGVVENGRADRTYLGRLLDELDTECAEPLELLVDVLHGEGGERDAVAGERGLEGLLGRMRVGLEPARRVLVGREGGGGAAYAAGMR